MGSKNSIDHIALLLCALSSLLLSGCGSDRPETIPTTGTITYQGKPVEGAGVMFMCKAGRPAYGDTDADGHFTLSTFVPGDGAIEGEHTVTVSKGVYSGGIFGKPVSQEQNAAAPGPRGEQRLPVQVIPPRYTSPTQSPLKARVTADGDNDFTFDLTD